jgi:hypothetical protein
MDPRPVDKAQSRADWHSWKAAMDREIESLRQAGTWETVPRPTSKNVVSCKWVFRIKRRHRACVLSHRRHDSRHTHESPPSWKIARHALSFDLRDCTATLAGEWWISVGEVLGGSGSVAELEGCRARCLVA